jgi:signal transduction histidine kinase
LTTRAPDRRPLALGAVLAVGLAFALGAEWVRLAAGWPPGWVLVDVLPGLAFLACGGLAWLRRPDSPIGPVMIATGFAWYAGTYAASSHPIVGRLASGFQGWFDGLLAWLVLAYPTGRLRTRAARLVVAALVAILAARSVVRLVTFRRTTDYDFGNLADVDRYVADQLFRADAETVFRLALAAVAVGVLILVARRLRTETDLGRRIAGPILLGGLALASGIVVETAALTSANGIVERSAAWDVADLLTASTAALVAGGFVVGLARARLARGAVADLVVDLGRAPGTTAIEELLARALGDPTLRVAYPTEPPGRFVDAAGDPIDLPDRDDERRTVTRLEIGGRTVAALVHDPALVDRPEVVRAVAAAAGLALENERLAADVRSQLEEVRRSRSRIVAAGDAERRRIERDIHDGAQQQLVTVAVLLQVARTAAETSDPAAAAAVGRAADQLELALAELRRLARGLHPVVLVEEGLAAAIEALADRTPVPVEVRATRERFDPSVEATAWFVVSEALTNVVRHAQARRVTVTAEARDGVLRVAVADDGIGGAALEGGTGLSGLGDRVAAAGGTLAVSSEAGRGTTIRADIPCA